ncbi:DUF2345 domain-containing protein, partial [Duganella rhizosphaerae]|uniref:DUF2345 domain-containing protein n=1 Tax=Duganella rhizosphaerae TaxID=2885763 RepID=UPI00403F4213
KADESALDDKSAPLKAMLAAVSGMVGNASLDAAKADAEEKKTAPGDDQLPHASSPIIAVSGKAGLSVTAGQAMQMSNGETIALMSGADTQFVSGGQLRVQTQQAIGVLGGAVKAGENNIGVQMIAAKDAVDIQAQTDVLKVQARDEVNLVSANAFVDWAAAKSITLSTAGGANITIDGGNITVQCPGKLTIYASSKSFEGPASSSFALPALPRSAPTTTDIEFRHFTDWGAGLAGRRFKATLGDGSVRAGVLDVDGYARLTGLPAASAAKIEYLPGGPPAKSMVRAELDSDVDAFFNMQFAIKPKADSEKVS